MARAQPPTWAVGYDAVALPIAAEVFEPAFGLTLRPEIAALSMSGSSFLVAMNALLLERLRLPSRRARRRHPRAARTEGAVVVEQWAVRPLAT